MIVLLSAIDININQSINEQWKSNFKFWEDRIDRPTNEYTKNKKINYRSTNELMNTLKENSRYSIRMWMPYMWCIGQFIERNEMHILVEFYNLPYSVLLSRQSDFNLLICKCKEGTRDDFTNSPKSFITFCAIFIQIKMNTRS